MIKDFKDNFYLFLILTIFSLAFVLYFGFKGVYPIDSFLIYNGGYNVLNGYHPFKDYWSISGPILDYFQALLFYIFGVNWISYIFHAFLVNLILSFSSFYLFLNLGLKNFFAFLYSLGILILAYPQIGTPFMDHHAFYFSYLSIIFLSLALIKEKKIFWILFIVSLFISFLSKQIPSSYLLILVSFFLFFYFYKEKNLSKRFLKLIFLSSFSCIFFLISIFLIYEIPFQNFIIQYFSYPISIGDERIAKAEYNFKSIVLQYKFIYFSIIILFFYFIKIIRSKLKITKIEFKIILLNIILFFSFIFSQILTKNQILIFFLIPHFLAISHFLLKKFNGHKIFYFLIISLLLFSTLKYHERFNNQKKFMELNDANFSLAIDAKSLDKSLKGLNWITHRHMNNPELELNLLINTKKILNNNKEAIVLMTDYQFFPSIINLKTVSPLKWYDNMSIPNKKNKFYEKYRKFFKESLRKQKIEYVYLIGNEKWMIEDLFKEKSCLNLERINQILIKADIKNCF